MGAWTHTIPWPVRPGDRLMRQAIPAGGPAVRPGVPPDPCLGPGEPAAVPQSRVDACAGADELAPAWVLVPLLTNHAPTRQATPTTNETAMRTTWWPFAGVVWPK